MAHLFMLVMIDNYDSFTHNLVRYFHELGQQVLVLRNDAVSLQQLRDMQPQALLISPGPGTVQDAGITLSAIEAFIGHCPILGVCLGHQAIATVYGANVVRAATAMHGKRSFICHNGQQLFAGLPPRLAVTRYHSLVVDPESLPGHVQTDAWVDESQAAEQNKSAELMALSIPADKVFGVQFHPESVISQYGHDILAKFCQSAGLAVTDSGHEVMPANHRS